jgi:ABC-type Co2+ transport system permease subunit
MDSMSPSLNFKDILSRAIKYLVEGLAVAVAAYLIPKKKMNLQEIIMVALTAAAVFAILDLWAPSVGLASRQGAGFGVGAGLVGFGGIPIAGGVLPGVPAL